MVEPAYASSMTAIGKTLEFPLELERELKLNYFNGSFIRLNLSLKSSDEPYLLSLCSFQILYFHSALLS